MVETKENGSFASPSSASLYVGDLDAGVTEVDLMREFVSFSAVSARVCRDSASNLSLGYAYVNFLSHLHAEKAFQMMNHVCLNGKPMRIMWVHRDPLPRKTGVGSLFVKNMYEHVGGAELENQFRKYGTVVSCKVAMDEKGRSKGHGFVQMDTEEAAQSAIKALNGTFLGNGYKKLYVSKLIKKSERQAPPEEPKCTNLYIKNLDWDVTDDVLIAKFSKFGKVSSAVVMTNEFGKPRGFGFVKFENPEHANMAMEAMNGAQLGSKNIYVGQAQKKAERKEQLKLQFATKHDLNNKMIQGSNVYVKNLDESVDENALQTYFSGCGKVVSPKVMRDSSNGLSRGYGFVCFSSPEEATKAVATLNDTMFHGKHLYVAIAQYKKDYLIALQRQRAKILPVQQPISDIYPSTYSSSYYSKPQNPSYMHQASMYQQYGMNQSLGSQRFQFAASSSNPSWGPLLKIPVHHAHMQMARYGQYGGTYGGYLAFSSPRVVNKTPRVVNKTRCSEMPHYQWSKALPSSSVA